MQHFAVRRAFSLIELLVVILIIVLLVAILLPALGHVRESAKKAATASMLSDISAAITSFNNDNRRLPGYYSARDLGAAANETEGFTTMNNMLLDLAGGMTAASATGSVEMGASTTNTIWYNRDLVGGSGNGTKTYWAPPAKNFKLQDGTEGGTKFGSTANKNMRDLVDAWGMPILAWSVDPMASGPIKTIADFASENSANPNGPARFYWASNAGLLNATALGAKLVDQKAGSHLGEWIPARQQDMAAVLGSPGSPIDSSLAFNQILPQSGRGNFILQSAGGNGVFVGHGEKGEARAIGPTLFYGSSFKDAAGNPILGSDGKPTTADIMADFDDIFQSGN